MLNETRVNLKHLLEDIRDSYTAPLEEVILTELIANALDSRACRVDFFIDRQNRSLCCVDNGQGMKRAQLKEYHNIAASDKQRGSGIGFAGVGAKLALLLAEKVVTESRGGYGSRAATEWRLTNPYRAPWKFIPSTDSVKSSRGTAVTVNFATDQTDLLQPEFIRQSILKHFRPMFYDHLREQILRYVYKKPVEFVIDGELLALPEVEQRFDRAFKVHLGKSKRAIGVGFLVKKVFEQSWLEKLTGAQAQQSELPPGFSVSTFGKVIKGGWEWLGVRPKHGEALCGLVEIPALSELLTTNKNDFLSDSAHLKKYYQIRKSVQQALLPVLRDLGEYGDGADSRPPDKNLKPFTRQIESALANMTQDFPELVSLLGSRRKAVVGLKTARDDEQSKIAIPAAAQSAISESKSARVSGSLPAADGKKRDRRNQPGLTIVLEDCKDAPESLGRMADEVIAVNTLHPAWQKALKSDQARYHILMTVGLVLAEFLAPREHPQKFLESLLAAWGRQEENSPKLF